MARYSYRRLARLPARDEGAGRFVTLSGTSGGFVLEHGVLRPGGRLPSDASETSTVLFTLKGRGTLKVEGDRFEVQANDVVTIPAGTPFALETLGGVDWVFLRLSVPGAGAPAAEPVGAA